MSQISAYFTPGVKRTSRTALSTLIKPPSEMETATPVNKKRKQLFTSSGDEQDDANEEDECGTESASENISLSQMKKKSRRIKSLDHPSDPESVGGAGTPGSGNAASVGNRYHTVWKFKKFSIIHNLCEINFNDF